MVSDGPGADDPDDTDARPSPRQDPSSIRNHAASAPAGDETVPAEPILPPPPTPAPTRNRPVFVVAAHRAEVDEEDDGPLFIVPAVQPPQPAQPPALPATPTQTPPAHAPPAPTPPGPGITLPPMRRPEWAAPGDRDEPDDLVPRRRWRPGCFTILLLLVVASVGGAVYAYQNGALTPRLVLNAIGFGAAEIELVNLRDDAIRADIVPATQADAVPAVFRLAPFEVRTYRAVRPAELRFALVGADGVELGACTLALANGERLQVVALPDTTLIRRIGELAPAGADLVLDGSSLCR
jgi:hypothetical protein